MNKFSFMRFLKPTVSFVCFVVLIQFITIKSYGLHVTIIESQSYISTDLMDTKWQSVINSMGHTSTISPQSTLDNTSFFSTTDILLISSGSINLPANRVNTILQFLQTGKAVYLQGEYNCSLSSNQAFATLVNTLGGLFSWGGTTNGASLQMNILGSFANTPNVTTVLNNFNYGCFGSGCGVQYFLEDSAKFYGYFFCPPNPLYGSLIQTTDQDWVNNSTNTLLMKNIITHLADHSLCNSTNFTPTNLGNDTTLCNGTTLTLNATNSNATYLWQNGSTNPTFNVTTAGTYWVKVTNNCGIFSDTIHINYAPAPNVNLGNDTATCAGQQVLLNATTPGASYTWQDGSHNATLYASTPGIYSVTVNIGGCIKTDSIIVNFFPSPVVNLGNDTVLCEGDKLVLNATNSSATAYTWQDGTTGPTFTVTTAGTYSVTVSTPCGNVTDLININYKRTPSVTIGNDTTLCSGNTLMLDATTLNASYLWNDNSTQTILVVTTAGKYWVEVTVLGCKGRDTIDVHYTPTPQIHLGNDVKLCSDETLVLDATTQDAVYLWQDNSTSSSYRVTQKGNYWVEVKVDNCVGSDSIFVDYYTESCNCNMLVPNAFSPNGDGKNDEFKFITSLGNIDLKDFIIYTRWGKPAFVAQNINDSWDGKIKGEPAETGAYYYQIKYKCRFTGKEYFLKGDVVLIR